MDEIHFKKIIELVCFWFLLVALGLAIYFFNSVGFDFVYFVIAFVLSQLTKVNHVLNIKIYAYLSQFKKGK
ncbi:hypothetical protein LASUN_08170 [Lentilactobacillus sunkii]|uniref:Uncharacterized protein n=1 Tax=Lentilactobacillus sunkii TaxID=481719 RepID=A0A1E7XGL5_9LACO|nr:hypothetical protein LASUN_08170 [Lentilactobacillus sunkii]